MSRSYASRSGIPNPLGFGAVALIVFATLFGEKLELFGPAPPPSQMERFGGLDAALAPAEPVQAPSAAAAFGFGDGFMLAPSHSYEITALVLGRRDYRVGAEGALSPIDLLLGWGPMSNPALVAELTLGQGGRFGYVGARDGAGVDPRPLQRFWANTHLIPATPEVRAQLEAIGAGRVVRLTGELVDVSRARDGFVWRSSTTRRDRGYGACELLLVRRVEILE
jgi:hypothetical protein